jgi:hypothetical protein
LIAGLELCDQRDTACGEIAGQRCVNRTCHANGSSSQRADRSISCYEVLLDGSEIVPEALAVIVLIGYGKLRVDGVWVYGHGC